MADARGTPFKGALRVENNGTVAVRIEYRNRTASPTAQIAIAVNVPRELRPSISAVKILNASNPASAVVATQGVRPTADGFTAEIGGYTTGSNAFIVFPVSLQDPATLRCGNNTFVIRAQFVDATAAQGQTDEARLTYRGLESCS